MNKKTTNTLRTTLVTLTVAAFALCNGTADDKRKTQVIYRTNYVNVPVVCATLDVGDFSLIGGHSYKLMVADGNKPWRPWATLRPTTNTEARLWFPAASTRAIVWQLVDYTPGYNQTAATRQAPDCTSKPQWVVVGIGNVRPVR